MKTKQELRAYQKAYYQTVKKIQIENIKKEIKKQTIVSIELTTENKSLIVEL